MQSKAWQLLGGAILIGLLFPRDAFAYLDPGSGSLIFQTVVAAMAGVAYGVRVYWSRIRNLFSRRRPTTLESPPVDPQAPPRP